MQFLSTETLIKEICQKPIIWNRSLDCGKKLLIVQKTWSELAAKYDFKTNKLKHKWNNLRACFKRHYLAALSDSNIDKSALAPKDYPCKWIYYKSLIFLIDDIHFRENIKQASCQKRNKKVINLDATVLPATEEHENVVDNDLIEMTEDDPLQHFVISSVVSLSKMPAPVISPPVSINETSSTPPALVMISNTKPLPPPLPTVVSFKSSPSSKLSNVESFIKTEPSPPPAVVSLKETSSPAPNRLKVKSLEQLKEPSLKRTRCDPPAIELQTNLPTALSNNYFDEDYYFLIGLHPYLRKLEESQRLRIKMNMQTMIFNGLREKEIKIHNSSDKL